VGSASEAASHSNITSCGISAEPARDRVTLAVWGFLEGFFGTYFARKVNLLLHRSGQGWFAPGVLAFALFNGVAHLIVGQGLEGFLTSFASGYAIAVIPAVTGKAWGGTLVQTLTNAVGSVSR
jgi:hypothetical protein